MITDVLLHVFKKDHFLKRNLIKTISWRLLGSLDTVLISRVILGTFIVSFKIGLLEFLTKMLLYYFHERLWQESKFGSPSKRDQAQNVRHELKPNLFKQLSKVTRKDREILNNNKSFTLWLTGLSGAGKSTLANEIEEWIYKNKGRVYILDGDNTRLGINSDLSFSDEDRTENIRRVAEICRLFNDAGIIVIASFISPFSKDRLMAKAIIDQESFVEIYLEASLAVCQKRDKKGLYKRALEGSIKNFTGISSPYEQPLNPDLYLNTDTTSVEECLSKIKQCLSDKLHYDASPMG